MYKSIFELLNANEPFFSFVLYAFCMIILDFSKIFNMEIVELNNNSNHSLLFYFFLLKIVISGKRVEKLKIVFG